MWRIKIRKPQNDLDGEPLDETNARGVVAKASVWLDPGSNGGSTESCHRWGAKSTGGGDAMGAITCEESGERLSVVDTMFGNWATAQILR